MKVIISGASGFLGSHILQMLQNLEYDFVAVSRQKKEGFYHSANYMDLPDGDILIHLAETNQRNITNNKKDDAYQTNKNLLDHINSKKYKKVIYASSAAVYGDKILKPRKENEVISPYDEYSRIKIFSENFFNNDKNIIFRIANVFGPKMSKYNVISDIIKQINNDRIVLNSLESARDFIYVSDVVNAFMLGIKSDASGIFNLGSGDSISVGSLAKEILAIYGKKNTKIISKYKNLPVSNIQLDITHIYNIIGWYPETSIETGILDLIENGEVNG